MTLSGVLSMLGVLRAARRSPSITKLRDQDLEDQGDVDRIFDQNEAEDLRYPCRVLHKEQKSGTMKTVSSEISTRDIFR